MGGDSIIRMAMRTLLALVMAFGAHGAHAAAGDVGQPIATCVLRGGPGMDPVRLIRQQGGFDCATPQTDFGSGDFWVRSQPLSHVESSSSLEIRVGSLWQDRSTLYALYADGRLYHVSDDGRGTTRHMQLGAIIQHQLPASPVPLVRLMWHVEGSANLRGIVIAPRLASFQQATESNLVLGAIYAGFSGLCLALLVYNLALWGALRHRFQLAYCAMVTALMGYAVSSSGALAWRSRPCSTTIGCGSTICCSASRR